MRMALEFQGKIYEMVDVGDNGSCVECAFCIRKEFKDVCDIAPELELLRPFCNAANEKGCNIIWKEVAT